MLKDYLPDYMKNYREITEICSIGDTEINELDIYKNKVLQEFYLETATDFGIKRIEDMLGIVSSANESTEFRKFRIKSKLTSVNNSLIYKLNKLIPDGDYYLSLDTSNLVLTLKIPITNAMYINSVSEMLENTVPMNIAVECSVLYTPNNKISKYKHNELNNYTHNYIKEDLYEQ